MVWVKYKYFVRESSGDQYFGQYICGLKYLEQTSVVSTFFFDYNEYEKFGQIRMKINVESWVEDRIVF